MTEEESYKADSEFTSGDQVEKKLLANTLKRQINVVKHNGTIVPYDEKRISIAIAKAFLGSDDENLPELNEIQHKVKWFTDRISDSFKEKMPSGGTVHVGDIQDSIELTLLRHGEILAAELIRDPNTLRYRAKIRNEILTAQQEYLIAQSMGLDTDLISLPRFIPIRIYLSDGAGHSILEDAVQKLAQEIGFDVSDKYDPVRSSFFRKILCKSKELMTKYDLVERFQKAERHFELTKINLVQSEIDKNLAEAFSLIKKSLEGEDQAAIQLGSLFIIKTINSDGKPIMLSRVLSQEQLKYLEENPSIIQEPANVLKLLDSMKEVESISTNSKTANDKKTLYKS